MMSAKPSIARLTIRREFLHVAQGRKASGQFVMLQARPAADVDTGTCAHIRYGLTASKKVGNAVLRNRARRRLRVAMLALLDQHGQAGYDYVAVARTASVTAKWCDLLDDLTALFIRLSRHGFAKTPRAAQIETPAPDAH